jgi:hypothetical protein
MRGRCGLPTSTTNAFSITNCITGVRLSRFVARDSHINEAPKRNTFTGRFHRLLRVSSCPTTSARTSPPTSTPSSPRPPAHPSHGPAHLHPLALPCHATGSARDRLSSSPRPALRPRVYNFGMVSAATAQYFSSPHRPLLPAPSPGRLDPPPSCHTVALSSPAPSPRAVIHRNAPPPHAPAPASPSLASHVPRATPLMRGSVGLPTATWCGGEPVPKLARPPVRIPPYP